MENKELELLREFFNNVNKYGFDHEYLKIKNKILEIQKQNRLKDKIKIVKKCITEGPRPAYSVGLFNEILKELGYE